MPKAYEIFRVLYQRTIVLREFQELHEFISSGNLIPISLMINNGFKSI